MIWIIGLWILNFVISWFNAWGVGKTWNETKHAGGMAHFMNCMGGLMSASGFTWCYLLIVGGLGAVIPIEGDDGVSAPLLSMDMLQAFFDLGYLVIVFPILGSGLAIMVHSWGVFYRRRTLGNGAVAGWNTFANMYNVISALEHVPRASSGVMDFFFSDDNDRDAKTWVLLLVVLAVVGGVLTTVSIVKRTARATAKSRALKYQSELDEEDEVLA